MGGMIRLIVYEKKENSFHRATVVEEHIVLLLEPGSVYKEHVTPIQGRYNTKHHQLHYSERNYDFKTDCCWM